MLAALVSEISNFMYGKLLIVMLLGVGLYYTLRTRFIQVRLFGETLKLIVEKDDKQKVSSFQALMVSTASRVGTGNMHSWRVPWHRFTRSAVSTVATVGRLITLKVP